MICAKVRRMLAAYLDAELPADRRGAVRRHLRECDDCQGVLDGLKNLTHLAERWSNLQPAAALWQVLGPKLMAACASAAGEGERDAALSEPCRKQAQTRQSYKPAVEGLEDRYAMSHWLCAAAVAVAAPIAPALASWWSDYVPCESSRSERGSNAPQFPGQALFLHWFSAGEFSDFATLAISA